MKTNNETANVAKVDADWFCAWCDKPMAETDEGYHHTDSVCYCTEACAKEHDSNL